MASTKVKSTNRTSKKIPLLNVTEDVDMSLNEKGRKEYRCKYCGKKQFDLSKGRQHQQLCHKNPQYVVQSTMLGYRRDVNDDFHCLFCKKILHRQDRIASHIKQQHKTLIDVLKNKDGKNTTYSVNFDGQLKIFQDELSTDHRIFKSFGLLANVMKCANEKIDKLQATEKSLFKYYAEIHENFRKKFASRADLKKLKDYSRESRAMIEHNTIEIKEMKIASEKQSIDINEQSSELKLLKEKVCQLEKDSVNKRGRTGSSGSSASNDSDFTDFTDSTDSTDDNKGIQINWKQSNKKKRTKSNGNNGNNDNEHAPPVNKIKRPENNSTVNQQNESSDNDTTEFIATAPFILKSFDLILDESSLKAIETHLMKIFNFSVDCVQMKSTQLIIHFIKQVIHDICKITNTFDTDKFFFLAENSAAYQKFKIGAFYSYETKTIIPANIVCTLCGNQENANITIDTYFCENDGRYEFYDWLSNRLKAVVIAKISKISLYYLCSSANELTVKNGQMGIQNVIEVAEQPLVLIHETVFQVPSEIMGAVVSRISSWFFINDQSKLHKMASKLIFRFLMEIFQNIFYFHITLSPLSTFSQTNEKTQSAKYVFTTMNDIFYGRSKINANGYERYEGIVPQEIYKTNIAIKKHNKRYPTQLQTYIAIEVDLNNFDIIMSWSNNSKSGQLKHFFREFQHRFPNLLTWYITKFAESYIVTNEFDFS